METEVASSEGRRMAAEIMDEVRRRIGKPITLVAALEREGVESPKGGRYSESIVSSWARGAAGVPSDVLLVAARLAKVSIDEYIAPSEAAGTDARDRKRLAELERNTSERFAKLEAAIHELGQTVADLADALDNSEGDSGDR